MKPLKVWGNILFVVSIITPLLSFMVLCSVGDVNTFGTAGMLHYTWIMWLFIPISVASLIIGICLKKRNEKYKKNVIVACIVIPILLLFGSYKFIFSSAVSYDADVIKEIEQQTEWTFPSNVETATTIGKNYRLSYIKITDKDDNIHFEENVISSDKWKYNVPNTLVGMIPVEVMTETQDCRYFMFYNKTLNQYNVAPTNSGVYDCVYMAYDETIGRIIVLFDYTPHVTT